VHSGPTIAALLRAAGAATLADPFAGVPVPASFAVACGIELELPPVGRSVPTLDCDRPTALLAGPGVLATGAVDALHRFARAANVGIANTYGAKGVFAWDSPFHLGTCGLQADDFSLLGFDDVEQIVAIGVDPVETPRERWARAPVVDVDPRHLEVLVDRVRPATASIETSELYRRIAAVAQPGYVDDSVPRHPARAVADLAVTHPDAIVIAQPGPTGLWLGRVLPTDRPGRVTVPARAIPGIAAALALVAHQRGVEAVAVTLDPVDAPTRAALDLEPDLRVLAWGEDVDWSRTAELIAAAGPVDAWT
jgi:thiamine pyrophosphate-dependent acetolactate synthase large subunit-like protein